MSSFYSCYNQLSPFIFDNGVPLLTRWGNALQLFVTDHALDTDCTGSLIKSFIWSLSKLNSSGCLQLPIPLLVSLFSERWISRPPCWESSSFFQWSPGPRFAWMLCVLGFTGHDIPRATSFKGKFSNNPAHSKAELPIPFGVFIGCSHKTLHAPRTTNAFPTFLLISAGVRRVFVTRRMPYTPCWPGPGQANTT